MSRKRPVCCVLCRRELPTAQGLTGHFYAVHQRPSSEEQKPDYPRLGGSWMPAFFAKAPELFNH